MPSNNQIEKIEAYHAGDMSEIEQASFEKELASNPDLASESQFQGEIINGIKEYRKEQLKSRLDAIDVSPGWMEFVQQSALVKSFGGLAVATLVGSGVFYLAESKEETAPKMDVAEIATIDAPEIPTIAYNWDLPTDLYPTIAVPKVEQVERAVNEELERETVIQEVFEKEEKEEIESTFSPQFNAPDAGDVSDNNQVSTAELDEVPESVGTAVENSPIAVETKNTKSSKIKYKYYDGKLFLNGDFKNQPYEIIEINSASGRRIYLLHAKKYYEIKINDRLTELPEVRDIKLIQELRLIKQNK